MCSMPPRYVYWTILAGGLPTAFRAAEKDELLPTFKRIQEKQPDAVMKFFARGKLWDSPEQALRSEDYEERTGGGERRGRDWRPGGEHRDPRQPFKDAKKARNQDRRQERWEHKQRPHGDPLRKEVPPERRDRQARPDRQDRPDRPERRTRPFDKTERRPFNKPGQPARKDWRDKPPQREWRDRPAQQNWRDRPPQQDWRARPPKQDWRNKPHDRPQGDRHEPRAQRPDSRERNRSSGFSGKDRPPRTRPHDAPRQKPHGDKLGDRPFRPKSEQRFDRQRERGQHAPPPPRPPGPNREPRPGKEPAPEPPPRPSEPTINPPGPPERGSNKGGRLNKHKRDS